MKIWSFSAALFAATSFTPATALAPPMTGAQLLATPQCTCIDQCETMWAAAPRAMEDASAMRVRFANNLLIETYVPSRSGLLHGRATKTPNGYGGYILLAEFDSRFEPPESYKTAIHIFNVEVNTAGAKACPIATE